MLWRGWKIIYKLGLVPSLLCEPRLLFAFLSQTPLLLDHTTERSCASCSWYVVIPVLKLWIQGRRRDGHHSPALGTT